jgi:Uncharacterized protein conserved in bacteria
VNQPVHAHRAAKTQRIRRHDPGRRDRLVTVTLDVIAEHGVAATTHRAVAAAADVPLGSMTYHFTSRADLLAAAFSRYADTAATRFEERMRAVPDNKDLSTALRDHIVSDLLGSPRDLVLAYELYLAAARTPALRVITQEWMRRSRSALECHVESGTARAVDALMEGLTLHNALASEPMSIKDIEGALRQILQQ